MIKHLEIDEREDDSVVQLLNKTADELHKKYTKQRKIKERYLQKKSPLKKIVGILTDILVVCLLIVGFIVCFSSINSSISGGIPSFAGYTNMIIASSSMVNSGYEVGDVVIVHSVKPETLNVGDKIAFYIYDASYENFSLSEATNVSEQINETKYSLTFSQLLGFQSPEVKQAVGVQAKLVFHHIKEIYEDENGTRWFKTYGSSNSSDDSWYVNENLIVGVEDTSLWAKAVGGVSVTTKPYGIIIILIPAIVMFVIMVVYFLRSMQIAKLELDCVEEKRKITDTICVKNNVGYQMANKTKYKILAQATDANRGEYIKLLWKDGHLPESIQKYYIRKRILLNPIKDLCEVNRTCEQMFRDGEKPTKIAKYYLEEKQKIEDREEKIKQRLKALKKAKG